MNIVTNKHLTGERTLFKLKDSKIEECLFDDGESPLKECENLNVINCTFGYKYPLWYGKKHYVKNCTFLDMSRSGVWYTTNSTFTDCKIIAPKLFRRCSFINLNNLTFDNALETLWTCNNVKITSITVNNGDYFGKDSTDIEIDDFKLNGNYCFDGGKNIFVKNSILNSKDAFWNCENIIIENSTIIGEYFGWNSKNITLKNCNISSHQGFCYIKDLTLIDCNITDSDLIFEYCSNINADINSVLESVKNPISGIIKSKGISNLILDDDKIDFNMVEFKEK